MKPTRLEHGGGLGHGRRKITRPVSTREPMYLLLRSNKARGRLAMDRVEHAGAIRSVIERQAGVCRIEVLQFANDGAALHFLIRVPSRASYLRFIRSVSGLISRHVTGSERGPAQIGDQSPKTLVRGSKKSSLSASNGARKNRFWDILPYSRIATGAASIRSAQKSIDLDVRRELGLINEGLRLQAQRRPTRSRPTA